MAHRLKYGLLRIVPKAWINFVRTLGYLFRGDYLKLRRSITENENATRFVTSTVLPQYHGHVGNYKAANSINQHEARIYSQNGEDGILLFLLSKVGTADLHFVEFGVGDGRQCNTANLALNFGWKGLMMESNREKAAAAREYFERRLGDNAVHVTVLSRKVTAENINAILEYHDFTGEIDLLSIDVDGNDYWIWRAISAIRPRIIVSEYNASFGTDRSITVKYDPNLDSRKVHPSGFYHGASLSALTKLGIAKGYALVGCDSTGINAFFVREELAPDGLKNVSVAEAYYPHMHRTKQLSLDAQFNLIKHLEFIEI